MSIDRAIPLYLMAKAPVAGAVKTRMRSNLTGIQSAALARQMLEQSTATACNHWCGEVVLCVTPNADHPLFVRLTRRHALATTIQRGADLGARMMQVLKCGIQYAGCAAVMGCDVPYCAGTILCDAHAMLVRGENIIGASEDGGFYFMGLQHADDALFDGIQWGQSTVFEQVCVRARSLGIQFSELPRLRDIDRYEDVEWLASFDDTYRSFLC